MGERSEPTDADLVARVLDADREAFAVVYDRYGPRLYDFAYSMLRHREDASDAVADSFVLFAERLAQLREPDRLRPWLYAIVRSECLRRLKARTRVSYGDDELLAAMPDSSLPPEAAAEQAALRQLVWDASAGLADRDRALLDLHLRQGLEGAELGEAMGVTAANAYVMVNRLKAQVERSLGALLVAQVGRRECDDLDALLRDWDGSFSPLIRKRVARHIEDCDTCGERRKRMVSPWVLLAGVPLFAAPAALRDRVLDETVLVSSATTPGASGGTAVLGQRGRWSRRTTGVAAAAALLAAATVTTVVAWPEDDSASIGAPDVVPTTTAVSPTPGVLLPTSPAPTTTLPTTAATPTVSPTGPSATPSGTPSSPPVTAGKLVVSTTAVDLGRSTRAKTFTVRNTGGMPVTFAAAPGAAWLLADPDRTTVAPGGSRTVAVGADRSRLPEGIATRALRLTWPGGSATVQVSVRHEIPPTVGRPTAPTDSSCALPVSVAASDNSGLADVVLRWTGPDGTSGTLPMSLARNGRWEASVPTRIGGAYTLRATATDDRGNTTTGTSATVGSLPCPQ